MNDVVTRVARGNNWTRKPLPFIKKIILKVLIFKLKQKLQRQLMV